MSLAPMVTVQFIDTLRVGCEASLFPGLTAWQSQSVTPEHSVMWITLSAEYVESAVAAEQSPFLWYAELSRTPICTGTESTMPGRARSTTILSLQLTVIPLQAPRWATLPPIAGARAQVAPLKPMCWHLFRVMDRTR